MVKQRNSQNGFSMPSAGIGQQLLFNPEWADIDFADFQGLNMGLVNQNAQFAQEVANDRLKDVLKQRDAILEKVKLHKRFDDLQGQLDGKMNSIIDNMGQLQLSDAANFTSLNTNLLKAKNDPVLQSAVQASEDARAYEKIKQEKPEIAEQPWNNVNEKNYQRFLNGETNDFSFNPIYKEYDLQTKADEFAKEVPADLKETIAKYGVYGLQEKAVEDKSVARVQQAFEGFKQGLMQDPEFMSWYKRRGSFEQSQGRSMDDVINGMFKSSAAKYGTTAPSVKVGMPQTNPDINAGIQLSENARSQARFNAEQAAGFPSVTGSGSSTKEEGPENYIDYSTGVIKRDNQKLTEDSKKSLMNHVLSQPHKGEYDYTIEPGKLPTKSKLKETANRSWSPTGNFRELPNSNNTGSSIYIELEDANGSKKYRAYNKNFFEQIVGSRGNTGTPTNGSTVKYKGVDANGNPIFE